MKKVYSIVLCAIGIPCSIFAGNTIIVNDTRYDVRYITNNKRQQDEGYQAVLRESPAWKTFSQKHPSWNVLFNEENQKPTLAYGAAIPLEGRTVTEKALNFIHSGLSDFSLPLADISIYSVTTNAEKFDYVNLLQTYKGLQVIDSRVQVKMTKSGEVIFFKTDIFDGINIGTSPTLPAAQVLGIAKEGFTETITNSYTLPELKILPVPGFHKYEYHLVYELYVETYDSIEKIPANYYTLIDANDGKILYRENKVLHYAPVLPSAGATVNGTLNMTNPYSASQVMGLPYVKIVSGGATYYTDASGNAANVPAGSATLSLTGRWCNVMTGSTTPSMTATLSAGSLSSFDNNSTDRERTAYYHISMEHDFVKSWPQLKNFNTFDSPMKTIVDVTGSCNAFYNGNCNFYAKGGQCNATSLIADVMYHEYGHGLNSKIYSFYGHSFGNGAMGEGYGDVWAMSITKNPVMGVGFYTGNQNGIRRYDPPNRKVYPANLVGEVHADGQIIAGAWWEVGLNMNNTAFMTNLFINTFPDGITGASGSEGTVYKNVLTAALQADDDDNDLCNGTPHSVEILKAFSAHGITISIGGMGAVTHTPVLTQAANTAIDISATVASSSATCGVTGGELYWRTSNTAVWTKITMNYASPNLTATIPAQAAGTIVQYYFGLLNSAGKLVSIQPARANAVSSPNIPYYVLVGFTPNMNLYSNMGDGQDFGVWNSISAGNSSGSWVIDVPIPSYLDTVAKTGMVQPGMQVTVGGKKCAVTGNAPSANNAASTNDVSGGSTRLESPSFSLVNFTNPVITYYRTFSSDANSPSVNLWVDPWVTEISNDNGGTWKKVEFTKATDVSWRRFAFKILDYTALSSQMKMRFTASDSVIAFPPCNGQNISEAALDEFQVWDGPLLLNVNNPENVSEVYLFPNPATDNVTVSFNLASTEDVVIQMINPMGQIVLNEKYGTSNAGNLKYKISTSELSSGIYQLRIATDKGTVTRKVSIVK
jgi:Zn-dependent metalloprotease